MKLKNNALQHRISWVKKDLKRIIILIGVPISIALFFPSFGYSFLGITFQNIEQQIRWSVLPGGLAFLFCFVVQLLSNQKPDYEQDIKAALFFSPYLFFINAFAEELFFRGFLLSLILYIIKSPILSIIISSIIFGYYHMPMFGWTKQKALLAFLGGLYFGTIFTLTKSLFVVWIAHGFGDIGLVHESIGGYIVWTKIRYKELLNKQNTF